MQDSRFIRSLVPERDTAALAAFLSPHDQARLEWIRPALEDGDALALVIEHEGSVAGWAVLHVAFRDDLGWFVDEDTIAFQTGERAYLEYIEVREDARGLGLGKALLSAIETVAWQAGKRVLWLHTGTRNERAQRLYQRAGWTYHASVTPLWSEGAELQIYTKTCSALG